MSQSIPTGYIPPDNPQGLAQKTCPGNRDLILESCPGAGNSTRAGIMWKMKLKLQKNSVDQISTGKNKKQKKASRIFDLFRGLRVFSVESFLVYGSILWFYCHTYLTKKSEELPLACLFEVFTGLCLSTPTFCIKSYDHVKLFVRVLVLLVINTGYLKKFLQYGSTTLIVDFQFNLC